MNKWNFITLAALTFGLGAAEEQPYANRALNPVKFAAPERHAPIPLVKDGKLNFVIVRDLNAERGVPGARQSITRAAEALQDAFFRTTGRTAKIVDAGSAEAKNAPYVIAVGKSALTDQLGLKPPALPKEAFLVKSFPRGVVIAGHDGSLIPESYDKFDWTRYRLNGTLNGVYDFNERILGMRYYYPGIGIVAPKITDLTLRSVSYTDGPYFRNRFNWAWNLDFRDGLPWKNMKNENNFDNAWRLAMSTRFNDVCHTPQPRKLLAAYPDKKELIFFKDRRGYLYYNPATHIGNLMDVTNPELAHLLVQSYKKFYATGGEWDTPWKWWYPPNSEYVLFGQADTFVSDLKSEKNKHLFPEERRNNDAGMCSDLYMNFYCWIARELKKELPGKRLGVLAYHNYTLPPLVCKDIPDNIDVQVCMGRIVLAKSKSVQDLWHRTFSGWYEALGKRGGNGVDLRGANQCVHPGHLRPLHGRLPPLHPPVAVPRRSVLRRERVAMAFLLLLLSGLPRVLESGFRRGCYARRTLGKTLRTRSRRRVEKILRPAGQPLGK